MSDLPKGWTECSLGEIIVSKKGKKPKSTIKEFRKGYIPYILIDEMEGKPIRAYTNDNSVQLIHRNDVLLVWDGSIGKCGSGIEGAIGSTLVGLSPLGGIPTKFLEYTIKQLTNFIKGTSTGTGLQHINKDFFKICKIVLPPLNEQERIAAKLDKLLSKVETAKTRLDLILQILKRFRQSVLSAAVSGELTKEWRAKNSFERNIGDFVETIKRERECFCKSDKEINKFHNSFEYTVNIENKWLEIKAELVCDFITKGTTPKYLLEKGDIPFLKVYNIIEDSIDFNYKPQFVDTKTHKGFLKRSIVYPNDILMNIVGPPLGKVAIVTSQFNEWNINQALAIFRPIKSLLPNYLYYFLKDGSPITQILLDTKGIVGQSNISLEQCRNIMINIPSIEEQKEIVRRVEQLFKFADQIEARYNKAKQYADKLTQSLLAKAFRGELVPQDPNDEPAEKLLERIKSGKKHSLL